MSLPVVITPEFARHIAESRPESGTAWLDDLPTLVERFASRWRLTVHPPFDALSYNYVTPVTREDGSPAVLKLSPWGDDFVHEIAALVHYRGEGAVRVLESEPAEGAALLERLLPGAELVTLSDDEQATRIAARVMRRLWRPPPPGVAFPSVTDWALGFEEHLRRHGGYGLIEPAQFDRARDLYDSLGASAAPPVVLHGDLHHFNILSSGVDWVAIDPHGVIGEPVYETGALLRNPNTTLLSLPDPAATLARRVEILAEELGFDQQRIREWGFAQAVLSAIWTLESRDTGHEFALTVAGLLEALG